MKQTLICLLILCLCCLPARARIEVVTLPAPGQTQLTIYNSADLTLVRDRRVLTFKQGENRIEFSWANTRIDPTSVTFEALEKKDKLRVLDTSFPPRVANTLVWTIDSQISGKIPVVITYFTAGLTWNADYTLILDGAERQARLEGYVSVRNGSGEDYADSQVRLVVGKINLVEDISSLSQGRMKNAVRRAETQKVQRMKMQLEDLALPRAGALMDEASAPKEIIKEGLSEYFIYTVEGRETIADQWARRLPAFRPVELPVDALFKHEDFRLGPEAVRFVTFRNDKAHQLGESPLPDGSLRVFKTDANGNLQYLGASSLKYIPVDETVEVNLGPDPEVKVEIELVDYQLAEHQFDHQGNVSGWDTLHSYRVKVRNFKNTPLRMRILRRHRGKFQVETTEAYRMDDQRTVRFDPEVAAGTDKIFHYTIRSFHGRNADGK